MGTIGQGRGRAVQVVIQQLLQAVPVPQKSQPTIVSKSLPPIDAPGRPRRGPRPPVASPAHPVAFAAPHRRLQALPRASACDSARTSSTTGTMQWVRHAIPAPQSAARWCSSRPHPPSQASCSGQVRCQPRLGLDLTQPTRRRWEISGGEAPSAWPRFGWRLKNSSSLHQLDCLKTGHCRRPESDAVVAAEAWPERTSTPAGGSM